MAALELAELAKWLADNDLENLAQLRGAEDPSEWPGAESFNTASLNIIRALKQRERSRSPRRIMYDQGSDVLRLLDKDKAVPFFSGGGPRKAVRALQIHFDSTAGIDRAAWLEDARVEAIVGSCRKSIESVKSGLRCYLAFVQTTVNARLPFPPKLEWLQAWATRFQCDETFSNYVGYVKTGCILV